MKRNIIWAFSLFFIQPNLILGLMIAFLNYKKRVAYSREKFRVNFIRSNIELRDFLFKGVLPGLISSIVIVALGVPITVEWYLIYQLIVLILLLVSGTRFIHPIFTFSLSIFSMYLMQYLGINWKFPPFTNKLNSNIFTTNFKLINLSSLSINILFISLVILLLTTLFMQNKNKNKHFPIMKRSHRGKSVATYQNKILWLLPLLVIVPGEIIIPFASWWPLFQIGGENYAFLFLPILIGFDYKISTQFIEEATQKIKKEFQFLAIIGLLLLGGTYFYQQITLIVTTILFTGSLLILYRHFQQEKQWMYKYGPVADGIRIISVRPKSPAERMGLVVGDIILNMNNHRVNDQEEFNEIVAYNRSYISMRIERKDGEIIIAETPLYDDDYNNLGLLILEK